MEAINTIAYENFTALVNNPLFLTLIVLIFGDYVTGVIKAIVLRVFDSTVGSKGILMHCAVVIAMMCIWITASTYGAHYVGSAINLMLCVNYVWSILENLATMGVIKNERLLNIFRYKIDKYISKFEEKE